MRNLPRFLYLAGIILVVIVIIGLIYAAFKKSPTPTATAGGSCTSRQFSLGSSGSCVSDIQTMVDFIETDSLTQCPFSNAGKLSINSSYDSQTKNQVEVVQVWMNCYNKQEGTSANLATNGVVNSETWSDLCNYGYEFPKNSTNSTSAYLKATLAAGKNAGC